MAVRNRHTRRAGRAAGMVGRRHRRGATGRRTRRAARVLRRSVPV